MGGRLTEPAAQVGPESHSVHMAPPLFADLFKTSNDLFVKDYKDLSPKLEATFNVQGTVRSFWFSCRFHKLTAIDSMRRRL